MEKVVEIDGKPVKLRCTAALPRFYRATFGRDFFGDITAISKAAERKKNAEPDDSPKRHKRRNKADPTARTVTFIENLAFLMARSGDPEHVPPDITQWLDSLDDPNAVLNVADQVIDLYQLNSWTTSAPKKKSGQ